MSETYLKKLRVIEVNAAASQREPTRALSVCLIKPGYCFPAVMGKGLVKADNFEASPNKGEYLCLQTPKGFEANVALAANFVRRK